MDPWGIAKDERPVLVAVLRDPDRPVDPARPPRAAGVDAVIDEGQIARLVDRTRWRVVTDEPDLLVLRRVRGPGPA